MEIVFLLLLIVANGILAMFEAAMISARRARLQHRAEEGDAGAIAALRLAEDPNRFLSTIQIGITLVGILSGAVGGASLAERIEPAIAEVPFLTAYSEAVSVGLVVVAITYLSLVVGELVPKRLALNNAEGISALLARPVELLARAATPIVVLLSFSTRVLLLLLGIRPSTEPPVTEDELKFMLEEGAEAGIFEAAEQKMAENVFRLDDWRVSAVMTPHPEIIWLDLDDPASVIIDAISNDSYMIYPVYQGDIRNVAGVVALKDLWSQLAAGNPLDLRAALKTPIYIPETATALQALELFRHPDRHLALVIDEHGGIVGLLTVIDILEAVIGDLPSTASPQAVQREDGSWLIDGTMNTTQFEEMLDISLFPEAEERNYQTLSGFMMYRLNRIPTTTDTVDWQGYRFEVVDMDGHRVDKVLMTALTAE